MIVSDSHINQSQLVMNKWRIIIVAFVNSHSVNNTSGKPSATIINKADKVGPVAFMRDYDMTLINLVDT